MIKQDGKVQDRLKTLIEYAVKTGLGNKGVFLSDDESAAAIFFKEPVRSSLKNYWNQMQLIRKAIGISRIPLVLRREGYLKKHRPDEPHLNFWFLGVGKVVQVSMTSGEESFSFHRSSSFLSFWKPW